MPCYSPLEGYRKRTGGITWRREESIGQRMKVSCGQCIGCRLERSREWALRCMAEAQSQQENGRDNAFITLTYAPEHLPADRSLNKAHFQRFMKNLRHRAGKVRYYHCGEYGAQLSRPHYHAAIFGFGFPDKKFLKEERGQTLFTSDLLREAWPYGFSTVGSLTFESAAYVARYIMKKQTGEKAHDHYQICDASTGELISVLPEYTTMSLKPGIGQEWYEKYKKSIQLNGTMIHKGYEVPAPRYFRKLFEIDNPEEYEKLRKKRVAQALAWATENTPERLAVREFVKKSQIKNLKRELHT